MRRLSVPQSLADSWAWALALLLDLLTTRSPQTLLHLQLLYTLLLLMDTLHRLQYQLTLNHTLRLTQLHTIRFFDRGRSEARRTRPALYSSKIAKHISQLLATSFRHVKYPRQPYIVSLKLFTSMYISMNSQTSCQLVSSRDHPAEGLASALIILEHVLRFDCWAFKVWLV